MGLAWAYWSIRWLAEILAMQVNTAGQAQGIVALFLTQKPDDRIYYRDFITMVYQALVATATER
jgi:hypothetical protein